ncbi:helix-turn-helix domain-containing protein [bacterium]|nr:helix-turn-helix domain-containing protein [bacterium]
MECFWELRDDTYNGHVQPERILPDGCFELVLNFGESFKRYHSDGSVEVQPPALVVGQMTQHVMIQPTGRIDLLGIRFHPGGAFPFFKFPQSEITDRIFNIEDLIPFSDFFSELYDQSSTLCRKKIIETWLSTSLRSNKNDFQLTQWATQAILARNGVINLKNFLQTLGISERQMERLFKNQVGLSPKMFARIIRFQSIFRALESESATDWSPLAFECGYYDQSHFLKDFKSFAGELPSSYFAKAYKMSELLTRKNRPQSAFNFE